MTDNLPDIVNRTDWSDVISKLNLPELIAGNAGKAISRLIGSAADIPAAWLERYAKIARAKTQAQVNLIDATSKIAVGKLANDDELAERALSAWIPNELRRLNNKEEVVRGAIEHIAKTSEKFQNEENPSKIDDDWLNVFEKHAENASSDMLRNTWSRILAGEIRKPGIFSLSTLRIVSEIEKSVAEIFQKKCCYILDKNFIISHNKFGGAIETEIARLENSGLCTGSSGMLSISKKCDENNNIIITYFDQAFIINIDDIKNDYNISGYPLTKAGIDLLSIVDVIITKESIDFIDKGFSKNNVLKIIIGDIINIDEQGFQIRHKSIIYERPV